MYLVEVLERLTMGRMSQQPMISQACAKRGSALAPSRTWASLRRHNIPASKDLHFFDQAISSMNHEENQTRQTSFLYWRQLQMVQH